MIFQFTKEQKYLFSLDKESNILSKLIISDSPYLADLDYLFDPHNKDRSSSIEYIKEVVDNTNAFLDLEERDFFSMLLTRCQTSKSEDEWCQILGELTELSIRLTATKIFISCEIKGECSAYCSKPNHDLKMQPRKMDVYIYDTIEKYIHAVEIKKSASSVKGSISFSRKC